MIKILDTPEYMTVEEVKEKYYPLRVVLTNCELRNHAVIAGLVVAMETVPDDDYEELADYLDELVLNESNGEVDMVLTRGPLEGEWLCIEFSK